MTVDEIATKADLEYIEMIFKIKLLQKDKQTLIDLLKRIDQLLEDCNQIHSGSPIHERIKNLLKENKE